MKKILGVLSTTVLLAACGSDSSSNDFSISQDSYAAQLVASDFSSSAIVVGNTTSDRTASTELLASDQSDKYIASYKDTLYQIGRLFGGNNLEKYTATSSLENEVWNYSTDDNAEDSSNPYNIIHVSDSKAYVIRYGSENVWVVNPQATVEADFVTGRIDLSAYTVDGAASPSMAAAVIENNYLFVAMQRQTVDFTPQQAYVAVIDINTDTEIDTDPQVDGLLGIAIDALNPNGGSTDSIAAYNGQIYVAGRGDFVNQSGAFVRIDATTFEATTLANGTTFSTLVNNEIYHIQDVAIINDQQAYLFLEFNGFPANGEIVSINPTTGAVGELIDLADTPVNIRNIKTGPESRLWVSIGDIDNASDTNGAFIYVLDTDTNTLNGEAIELPMPAIDIEFLTVQ